MSLNCSVSCQKRCYEQDDHRLIVMKVRVTGNILEEKQYVFFNCSSGYYKNACRRDR